MNDLLFEDKIVSNEINENIKQRVATTTSNIPEGLPVNYFLKGNIKKIKQVNNKTL